MDCKQTSEKKACPLVKRGFSLTELMVVFSIIAVMTGVALTMSSGSKTNKDLETAGREVAQALRQAQNNALGGKLPRVGDDNTFACGYAFAYGTGANKAYRSGYVNRSTGCGNNADLTMAGSVTLKNNVEFALGGRDESIYFLLPRGDIYTDNNYNNGAPKMPLARLLGSNEVQAVTLKPGGTSPLRVDICVYGTGKIEEKPLRDSSDPSKLNPDC